MSLCHVGLNPMIMNQILDLKSDLMSNCGDS